MTTPRKQTRTRTRKPRLLVCYKAGDKYFKLTCDELDTRDGVLHLIHHGNKEDVILATITHPNLVWLRLQ